MRLRNRARVIGPTKRNPVLFGDRYLSPTGNDSNDGLTRGTAWATVSRLNTWIASLSAGTYSAVVTAGTYTSSLGFKANNTNSINLTVDFEPGVTIDSTGILTKEDGIEANSNPLSFSVFNLRGATFLGTTSLSANGIGTNNGCNLIVNGAASNGTKSTFRNYDDGFSMHGTGIGVNTVVVNDCIFEQCSKSAYAHISSSTGTMNRCVFRGVSGSALGVGRDESSGATAYNDCEFIPATDVQETGFRNATLNRCIFGGLTGNSVRLAGTSLGNNALRSTFNDCFFNAIMRTRDLGDTTITRCYGFLTIAMQEQPTALAAGVVRKCVFSSVGTKHSLAERLVDGVFAYTVEDCVIIDSQQIGKSFNATNDTNFIAAPVTFDFNAIFNTSVRAQIASRVTNTVTANPLVGSRATTNQSDWAVASNSPCVDAGKTGGNIGFTLADIG